MDRPGKIETQHLAIWVISCDDEPGISPTRR